ncbi:alpha/beta fold hydrolase [Shewanella intestini]|uniref:Alpha/beta fold hydrolase n=1 Tax=Shewanella intestini TaxID=2017544 RepID=A0ABS5I3D0_9GAMM|nr:MULTISPECIES: alpha/beta fold hydrolase [Shewanella]MBR9727900.1 alpha/beta fold hydrolase [Shewanella intestini]MRG36107.1 alpha/beta fold hydrolase [Shewanella sp. XMDDZSB0408]
MNHVTHGQGEPVILIHGLFGNIDNLKNLANSLQDSFRVTRVDLPNHGESEHVSQMDYFSLAKSIITLCDNLNLQHFSLVGHSMGGKVAMAVALLYPQRVNTIVIADIAPVTYKPRHDTVFHALMSLKLDSTTTRQTALAHLVQQNVDSATAQFLLKNLQRQTAGFTWKMNLNGLFNAYQQLIDWPFKLISKGEQWKPYTNACLIIRGADSDYVTHEHRDEIIAQFPHISAKTLNGTGHWLHAQKPEIFNRLVKEFLLKNSHP